MQPDTASPSLAVVIGTRNRLNKLRACLEALIGRIGVACEIVVVELGSTDGTLEYLQGLPGIRLVLDGDPIGQSRNLNRVFRTITAEYSCWLSDDNVVVEGMLDLTVSILEQNPDIGMVTLKVKDVTGGRRAEPYIGGVWPTGVLNCNQGVIRTDLFRQVGFFDEQFRTYGIDMDLTTKVLLEGYKVVYTKKVAVHHYRDHSASPGALGNKDRENDRQNAHETYLQKYKDLVVWPPRWRRRLYWRLRQSLIYPLYHLSRRVGIPLENWLGCDERDWRNLLYARYVSKLDFLENRRKPYYLVQSMPGVARK